MQAAAGKLGLEVLTLEIQRPQDIAPALEAVRGRADALYVCQDPLTVSNRMRINTLALGARLPVMHASREHIEAAGLMSYGPNFLDILPARRRLCRQDPARGEAGRFAGRAADQVRSRYQSDHCESARADVPEALLVRADEVIE